MRDADTELEVYAMNAYLDFDLLKECQLSARESEAHSSSGATLPTVGRHGSRQLFVPREYLEIATLLR
jgi:hypothetical protein